VAGRQLSSVTTLGLGNPVVSTAEAGGSVLLAVLSIMVPLLGLALVVVIFVVAVRWILFRQPRPRRPAAAGGGGGPGSGGAGGSGTP
jgi:hypothetical protein